MSGPQPEQIAKQGSEHAHQVALFCWAALQRDTMPELRLMFAIPNGGMRDVRVASTLKAEGVKASVPDIFLPVARGGFHGLFIELKKPATLTKRAGQLDPEQRVMMGHLIEQGYFSICCVGWEAARDTILAYMEGSL